jgi:hypothetical protein
LEKTDFRLTLYVHYLPEWIVHIQGIRVEVADLQLVEILEEILEGHPEFSVSLKYRYTSE